MKKTIKIETERLLLKPVSKDDAPFILKLYNSLSFIKFIGDRNMRTVEDAEKYITEKFLPQMVSLGYGNYLIQRKSDHSKIGAVGIFQRDGLEVNDIGFSLLEEFQDKGYGFESASKLMEVAFSEFNLKKIAALTSTGNFASQKLIGKLGLKYVKMAKISDDEEDLLYYEI